MYHKLQVIGYVGRDPEMRYTASGQPVTSFSVATSRKWTGSDGQPKDETIWFKVSTWNKLAETCNQYVTKGMLIMCEGRLAAQINIWTDQSGSPRAGYDLTADTVKFLSSRSEGREGDSGYSGSGYSAPAPANPAPAPRGRQNPPPPARQPAPPPPPQNDYPPDADYGGSIAEDEIPF